MLVETQSISEQKSDSTFYFKTDNKDPLFEKLRCLTDSKKMHEQYHNLNKSLAFIGQALHEGSELLEKWCLYIANSLPQQNGRKRIEKGYLLSISQELYARVCNLIPNLNTNKSFGNLLFLLHGPFAAAQTSNHVCRLTGKFIDDKYQIQYPVSVLEVTMNLLHAYHIVLAWYQLHHSTRNYWKIWLQWCWIADELTYFVAFVRNSIKKFMIDKCNIDNCKDCKKIQNGLSKHQKE